MAVSRVYHLVQLPLVCTGMMRRLTSVSRLAYAADYVYLTNILHSGDWKLKVASSELGGCAQCVPA